MYANVVWKDIVWKIYCEWSGQYGIDTSNPIIKGHFFLSRKSFSIIFEVIVRKILLLIQ